ncbi:hypothetical protein NQ317_002071 [Molorchus minor]|uniref:Uncharacterized protein n=1 Tax=Molorchus minor TaxID=1323400 RepID=A0ABQ9JJV4_9CUCU|nr:hypothetical protein NQ317_002071 [Molorchus minor]
MLSFLHAPVTLVNSKCTVRGVQTCVSDNLHLILSGGDGRKRQAVHKCSMEIRLPVIKAVFLRRY